MTSCLGSVTDILNVESVLLCLQLTSRQMCGQGTHHHNGACNHKCQQKSNPGEYNEKVFNPEPQVLLSFLCFQHIHAAFIFSRSTMYYLLPATTEKKR
jgi:hypothetical protein